MDGFGRVDHRGVDQKDIAGQKDSFLRIDGHTDFAFHNIHDFDRPVPVCCDKAARVVKNPEKNIKSVRDPIIFVHEKIGVLSHSLCPPFLKVYFIFLKKAISTYHKTRYALVGIDKHMIRLLHKARAHRNVRSKKWADVEMKVTVQPSTLHCTAKSVRKRSG